MGQYFDTFFSTYLSELSDRESLDNALQIVYDAIHEHGLENSFSSMVFTGMSGALFTPLLAYKLDKFVCGVRKRGEKSHSDFKLEGRISNEFVICDDITSSFKTIEYIYNTVKKEVKKEAECFSTKWETELKGIILYGIGNDSEKLKELTSKYNCWVLWQDKLFTSDV